MTDNEIVKALECCLAPFGARCGDCSLQKITWCKDILHQNTLDLINRQKEEIERLTAENKLLIDNDVSNKYPNCVLVEKGRIYTRTLEDYDELIGDISAEAYKEFAERIHCHCQSIINQEWNKKVAPVSWADAYEQFDNETDNLLKELVGDEK